MLRYAVTSDSMYDVKAYSKSIEVVAVKNGIEKQNKENTGIYLWPDDGTILMVCSRYGRDTPIAMIMEKSEIVIDTSLYPLNSIQIGAVVAHVYPLATAYYGSIEISEVRPEWFNSI